MRTRLVCCLRVSMLGCLDDARYAAWHAACWLPRRSRLTLRAVDGQSTLSCIAGLSTLVCALVDQDGYVAQTSMSGID